ncbi:MAG: metallophosphoesterase family protein [Leptospirales bacterium]
MGRFRFVHAADLHIDSPLTGLASQSEEFARVIENASRKAFEHLISLATDEACDFIVIAGDLFDGLWKDFRTGLFLAEQMRTLNESGILAIIVLGNHDAENPFLKRLEFSDNVRVLSSDRSETVLIDDLRVAIHGRSFPKRDVTDNLALTYPGAKAGYFNIGLLHTACTGREGHELYAPCRVEDLLSLGYDYWALGHVHTFEVLNDNPPVLFPGNLQGRHIRETGPKGAVLVTVEEQNVSFEHRPLDVVRWSLEVVEVGDCTDLEEVYQAIRNRLKNAADTARRDVAIRLRLTGRTPLHPELIEQETNLHEEILTIARNLSDGIWIEKLEIRTALPERQTTDPTIAARLETIVEEIGQSVAFEQELEEMIAELKRKAPHGAFDDQFFSDALSQSRSMAIELSKAIIRHGENSR